MKFEIGKEYVIGNKYKKSVEEFSFLNREKDRMVIEILWRSGEWLVTPQDEDECEILQDAYDNESDMEVCFQERPALHHHLRLQSLLSSPQTLLSDLSAVLAEASQHTLLSGLPDVLAEASQHVLQL